MQIVYCRFLYSQLFVSFFLWVTQPAMPRQKQITPLFLLCKKLGDIDLNSL